MTALRNGPRLLVVGIAIVGALLAYVLAFGSGDMGDPLNSGGVVRGGESTTQQLVNLDGHVQLVTIGTTCRDSKYGSGDVAVRHCHTKDDLGAPGGNWKGTYASAWNPPAPVGKSGDLMAWAAKYNYIQACTGAGGSCVNFDDGETAAWDLDETVSASSTIWWQVEGHYGSVDYCRRVYFIESGGSSEQVFNADSVTCDRD